MTKLSSCFCVLIWLFLRREDHVVSGRQRIMNGHRAFPRDYPFIARLNGCTGSLMSPTMVLTATHCFYNTKTGKLKSKSCGYEVEDRVLGEVGEGEDPGGPVVAE